LRTVAKKLDVADDGRLLIVVAQVVAQERKGHSVRTVGFTLELMMKNDWSGDIPSISRSSSGELAHA
jgi:hypothetical protein